ncbi:MAG TPA: DUF4433 domain-containing protein [Leptospiraceae bacterium]|nr:DUF4433 domain-containing protein [Leptospiraceae bacterium]HMY68197.1 DUF4433 domain-containing protein [Leptospiraceae bacterium]HMZ58964.1 DUF4433 domain-containing protein [Leptospiraceae bacterium]HNF16619.1 DUF4433 domain-containing protein [Leptospiraceae bacterium]HNF26608.1 DUF4433 domain-containing protein [Leptospiraceae bacterium]
MSFLEDYSDLELYRITHIQNLPYILKLGKITAFTHQNADPDFIGIGDDSLKENRKQRLIEQPPYGSFSDYIAFYFGTRSPMLYNIQNGYLGVKKRGPEEIIYLVSSFGKIKTARLNFVFFDGHANHSLTECFKEEKDFSNLDWESIHAKYWADTEAEPDRKRKKQAEFLVYKEMPIDTITEIGVYSDSSKTAILKFLEKQDLQFKIILHKDWYY